ncbi:MAG: ankyrin repeat domain-containing protein, partial [Candidatus Babeliales bacterium]
GSTSLHYAAGHGHTKVVEFLLAADANKDLQDRNGNTPLHRARSRYHEGVVKLLLDAGANTDIKNQFGKSALERPTHIRVTKISQRKFHEMLIEK